MRKIQVSDRQDKKYAPSKSHRSIKNLNRHNLGTIVFGFDLFGPATLEIKLFEFISCRFPLRKPPHHKASQLYKLEFKLPEDICISMTNHDPVVEIKIPTKHSQVKFDPFL